MQKFKSAALKVFARTERVVKDFYDKSQFEKAQIVGAFVLAAIGATLFCQGVYKFYHDWGVDQETHFWQLPYHSANSCGVNGVTIKYGGHGPYQWIHILPVGKEFGGFNLEGIRQDGGVEDLGERICSHKANFIINQVHVQLILLPGSYVSDPDFRVRVNLEFPEDNPCTAIMLSGHGNVPFALWSTNVDKFSIPLGIAFKSAARELIDPGQTCGRYLQQVENSIHSNLRLLGKLGVTL